MNSTAGFIALFAGIFVSILFTFLALAVCIKESQDGQGAARARRVADAKMNARLLRLNI